MHFARSKRLAGVTDLGKPSGSDTEVSENWAAQVVPQEQLGLSIDDSGKLLLKCKNLALFEDPMLRKSSSNGFLPQ